MRTQQPETIDRLSVVTHQGNTLTFAEGTLESGENRIFYRVTEASGEEDDYFTQLSFPDQVRVNGASLLTVGNAALGNVPSQTTSPLLNPTLPGKWHVFSDNQYVYLFRAVPDTDPTAGYNLYANRYLLIPIPSEGGEATDQVFRLKPKTEARYETSGLRETPANALDKSGYRNRDGQFFLEPVLLLPWIRPHEGLFAVTLTPSDQGKTRRWLLFAATPENDQTGGSLGFTVGSFLQDEYGWPLISSPEEAQKLPWFRIRDVIMDQLVQPTGMPASLYFRRQETSGLAAQPMITSPRILLAFRSQHLDERDRDYLTSLDFGFRQDGTLELPVHDRELTIRHIEPAKTALEFDGDRDYVRISETLPVFKEKFTFEAWVRHASGRGTIVSRSRSRQDLTLGFSLTWNDASDRLEAQVGLAADLNSEELYTISASIETPSSYQWHHVAFVFHFEKRERDTSSYVSRFYIDGEPGAAEAHEVTSADPLSIVAAGPACLAWRLDQLHAAAPPDDDFAGGLDEVRWWRGVRSGEEIRKWLYRELSEEAISNSQLIGYWKFDDAYATPANPDAVPWQAEDSSGDGNHGQVRGARWTTRTAPVYSDQWTDVTPMLNGLSEGMGLLTLRFEPGSRFTDPTLLDSADGCLHLYFGLSKNGETESELSVLQYDTTVARARFRVEWGLNKPTQERVSAQFVANFPGPGLNAGRFVNGQSVPVVALTTVPNFSEAADVVFTTNESLGVTETYFGVPRQPHLLRQVINGIAQDDPLAPDVGMGQVAFYDYSGTRPSVRISTLDGNTLLLITARNSQYRSALNLSQAVLQPRANDDCILEATFQPIVSRVLLDGEQQEVHRAFEPVLEIPNLPLEAQPFLIALKSGSRELSLRGANLHEIAAGHGAVWILSDTKCDIRSLEITPGSSLGRCDVTLRYTVDEETQDAVWRDVSCAPAEFMATLNLQAKWDYEQSQIEAAKYFVAVGANNNQAVKGSAQRRERPSGLAAFLNPLGPNSTGKINATGSAIGAGPRQGKTVELEPSAPSLPHSNASILFQVLDGTATGQEVSCAPQEAYEVGVLDQPGNFGGWIPTPQTTSGDFSMAKGEVALDGSGQDALACPGDFTLEAWIRLDQVSEQVRLINSNRENGPAYTAGYFRQDDYALSFSQSNEALSTSAGKFGTGSQFSLAAWWYCDLPSTAGKTASIATLEKPEWYYTFGYINHEGSNPIWEVTTIGRNDYGRRYRRITKTRQPIRPGWTYVIWEIDNPNGQLRIFSRTVGDASFQIQEIEGWRNFRTEAFNKIHLGNPKSISPQLPSTIGFTGRLAEVMCWDGIIPDEVKENLFRQQVNQNAEKLTGFWDFADIEGPPERRQVPNRALWGPAASLNIEGSQNAVAGPTPRHGAFAAAGERVVHTRLGMPLERWTHLAVISSNNGSVAFDGSGAVVPESTSLSVAKSLAIDGWIRRDAVPIPLGDEYILSKSDNDSDEGSFQLFLRFDGTLACRVFLSDRPTPLLLQFDDHPLELDTPYYFGFSCAIRESEDAGSVNFHYSQHPAESEDSTSGTADFQLSNQVTVSLDFGFYLQARDGSRPVSYSDTRELHRGTTTKSIEIRNSSPLVTIAQRASEPTSAYPAAARGYLRATLGTLRLWSADLSQHFFTIANTGKIPASLQEGLLAAWTFQEGRGVWVRDQTGAYDARLEDANSWITSRLTTELQILFNGQPIQTALVPFSWLAGQYGVGSQFILGAVKKGQNPSSFVHGFAGVMDDVRVWSLARSHDEIRINRYRELEGAEPELAGYWPIAIGSGTQLRDRTGRGNAAILTGAGNDLETFWWIPGDRDESPIGNEAPLVRPALYGPQTSFQVKNARSAPVVVEVASLSVDARGLTRGTVRRMYYYLVLGPLDAQRSVIVVERDFKVGDAELTFIGQAQSAPTLIGYMEGAPPVPSENLSQPFSQIISRYQAYLGVTDLTLSESDQVTYAYVAGKDTGVDMSFALGSGFAAKADAKTELAPLGFGIGLETFDASLKIGVQSSFSNTLGFLRSAQQSMGTSRLDSHRQVAAGNWVEDEIWSVPRYVPDNVGYAFLKSGVVNVYALRLRRSSTLMGVVMLPDPGIKEDFNLIMFPIDPGYTKQGTLDGMVGFTPDPSYPEANFRRGSYFKPREAANLEAQIEAYEAALEADYQAFEAGKKGRRQDAIHFTEQDPVKNPEATLRDVSDDAYDWENNRSRRNLVNSYVWTAASGFYTESEQTMASRQVTEAGTYKFLGTAGLTASLEATSPVGGFYVDGNALFGGHIDTHVSKSRNEDRGFSLQSTSDCEGFLADYPDQANPPINDNASVPGKVDAYRFKTFYLQPSATSFQHFFNTVVDPNWLYTSDSREAFALRQARASVNQVWRVLHRVTYVSRVPPRSDQVPEETSQKPERATIHVPQNKALIQMVRSVLPPKSSGGLAERVGRAVNLVLRNQPNDRALLSDIVPWWSNLLSEAEANVNSQSAATLRLIHETVLSYMIAFFQQGDE